MAGYYIQGGGGISAHFKLSEFACGNWVFIDPDFFKFVAALEDFRVWYNRPININSGYRTARKNAEVGGDSNSLHLYGRAIDFNLPDDWKNGSAARRAEFIENVRLKWFSCARAVGGFGQITYHKSGWVHMGLSFRREHFETRF